MKTKKEIIERYQSLISEEIKNKRFYGEITRYKRIIEIIKGINPIEEKKNVKN